MANEYWRQREEQALAEYQLTDDEYVKQLNDIYGYMVDQINREIRGFYSKYADAEGITMAEAAKRASELDMDEYSRKAKKYVAEKNFSAQANREMRLYNMTMKVNRLELLKSNIGLEMVDGFQDIEDLFGDSLTERAMDEFRRQAGILGNTVHDSAKNAKSIVGASFHNANWSDRIWMYQGMLRDELSTLLTQGMIQGRNPNELARHINNLFDAGKYNCERLMRTEMTRVQSDAQLQSFIANGFDEYQFNALGDACPDCKALDEQHFKITDAEPGENLPPIHPNCRCAVSAWMDDAAFNEWLDSYADHGMSYEDWLENRPTTVAGGNEALYKEWMDKFLNGDTDVGWDEWLKAKQEGKEPAKKKQTAKKKTATTKKKAEPAKKKESKDDLYDEWFDEYYSDKTDLNFEDWLEDRTGEKSEYRKFRSGDEADEYFRESGVLDDWEDYIKKSDEQSAVYGYTVTDYEIINDRLRGKNLEDYTKAELAEAAAATEKISDAISRFELKENIHVYRGCKDDALENIQVGDIYHDNGLMSTSTDKSAAETFLRQAGEGGKMLEIDVPAGTGAGAWVRPVSEFADENEFLMQNYGDYLVTAIDDDGTIHVQKIYPAA